MQPPSGDSVLRALESTTVLGRAAVDRAGRQTYVSRGFCAMLGYQASELVGAKAPFAYWPPGEIGALERSIERTFAGDIPPDGFRLRFARKDGSLIEVRLVHAPRGPAG